MTLMPVVEAQTRIVIGVEPLPAEQVSIFEAAGRVLAEDLKAKLTQPPFDASAMDGYAVRAADVASVPVRLKVIGCSAAGGGFGGAVGSGEAVRIFTGAPVPAGADTIVIQEDTGPAGEDEVEILRGARAGRHIRLRGCDFYRRRRPACGGNRTQKPSADAGGQHEPRYRAGEAKARRRDPGQRRRACRNRARPLGRGRSFRPSRRA